MRPVGEKADYGFTDQAEAGKGPHQKRFLNVEFLFKSQREHHRCQHDHIESRHPDGDGMRSCCRLFGGNAGCKKQAGKRHP